MALPEHGRPIVVGVDGTPESRLALDWAVDAAERSRAPLRVVTVSEWPTPSPLAAPPMAGDLPVEAVPRVFLQDVHEEAVAAARERLSPESVDGVSVVGSAIAVLLEESAGAGRLVVGSRARSAAAAVLLGSVSSAVAAHAQCPVTVVRVPEEHTAPQRVVVGVDESDHSTRALELAFEEAAQRGLALRVVHCWQPVSLIDPAVWARDRSTSERQERETWLQQKVAPYMEKAPHIAIESQVVDERPINELVEQSRDAFMVVVGSRGRGGFVGMLLGSVSQGLLHHAHCTVTVVGDRG